MSENSGDQRAETAPLADADQGSQRAAAEVPDKKPKIGDSRPAPKPRIGDSRPALRSGAGPADGSGNGGGGRRRRRGGRGRGRGGGGGQGGTQRPDSGRPVEAVTGGAPVELDEATLKSRRGRQRRGKPIGRYLMCVSVTEGVTQLAILEGRALIEHYISRPADDVTEIHGNVYLAKVQNVLPGMEAAFVDIGTPKNAVLYRGDLQFDAEEVEGGARPRIEQVLRARQTIIAQVTKNPIAHKGARLTQEVSLPGRFVVLVPNSTTYGISKRLPDSERKRLRSILDRVKPPQHGVIVRTAAEGITEEEIAATSVAWQTSGPRSSRSPSARRRPACSTASPRWPSGSSARSSTRTSEAS